MKMNAAGTAAIRKETSVVLLVIFKNSSADLPSHALKTVGQNACLKFPQTFHRSPQTPNAIFHEVLNAAPAKTFNRIPEP
jgi:hypothetical protein